MNPEDPALPSIAWLQRVNNALFGESEQAAKPRKPGIFYSVVPMRLWSSWQYDAETTLYKAKAKILSPKSNKDKIVDVYARAAGSPPEGKPGEWTFYAVWRGRWETLQQPVEKKPYVAGDGISIGVYDSELNGIPVVNMGVTNAQIAGESRKESKTLYFSPIWFKWIPSSLDIAGKREIAVKAKTVDVVTGSPSIEVTYGAALVVTDVVNGTAQKTPISYVKEVKVTDGATKKIVTLVGASGE